MQNDKKLKELKIIFILLFIFSCFPLTFIYMFLRDVSGISSFLSNYITSGNSIFMPFLPNIDLLWFFPTKYQTITFTLGHLIDIIILLNIVGYIQSSFYHSIIKKVCLSEYTPLISYMYLYTLELKEKIDPLSQDSDIGFGLYKDLGYPPNSELLGDNISRGYRFNEEIGNLFSISRSKVHKTSQNKIHYKKFDLIFKKRYKFFGLLIVFLLLKIFLPIRLKVCYSPQIYDFTNFIGFFKEEGG